jgi:hypothetical protein
MLAVNVPIAFMGIYLLKNIWGAALAGPFTLLAGLLFGYYHLRKHIQYSFRGILVTGYVETVNFIRERILKQKI